MEIVGYIHHIPIVIKKVKKLYLDTQSLFQKRNGCCSVYEFIPQLSGVTSQQGRVLPISEGLVAVTLCAYLLLNLGRVKSAAEDFSCATHVKRESIISSLVLTLCGRTDYTILATTAHFFRSRAHKPVLRLEYFG